MSQKCVYSLPLALCLLMDAAVAGSPSGGGFGQYTVSGGLSCPSGATCTLIASGSGFLQQQVVPSPGSGGSFQSILLTDATAGVGCNPDYLQSTTDAPTPLYDAIGEPVDHVAPRAYIPNEADGTVSIIDTGVQQTVATIPVQTSPYGVAIDPRGLRVYVSNRGDNSVSVIDADALSVVATLTTGSAPAGLALDHQGTRLLVAVESDSTVSVVDTKSLAEIRHIDVSYPPHDVVVSPTRPVAYVLSRSTGTISVLDLEELRETDVIPIAIGDYSQPTAIAVSPDGERIYTVLTVPQQNASLLAVTHTTSREVEYQSTFNQRITDFSQNADGSSLYLVPRMATTCGYLLELDTSSYKAKGSHLIPAGISRGVYSAQNIHLISQDAGTFIAAGYTATGTDATYAHAVRIGSQPTALGSFIGPERSPIATPDVALLDFGQAATGQSVTRTLNLTNTGSLPLKIYLATIESPTTPQFTVSNNGCSDAIELDASCEITVKYSPTSDLLSQGTLRIHTNSDQNGLAISLIGDAPAGEATDHGGGGVLALLDLCVLAVASFGYRSRLRTDQSRRRHH